jgi:hypothetical protein
MSKQLRLRRPTKKALRALALGLEEIEEHFVWEEFSKADDHGSESGSPQADDEASDDEDEREDEYLLQTSGFDREDVEIAIDAFISSLIRKKLVPRDESKPATLSDVFEIFLGGDHEATKTARSFESHIKGYFGIIDYENMSSAYSDLLELQDVLKKELEGCGGA